MVYRQHAQHGPDPGSDDPSRALIRLDVSGRDGADGRHGRRGADGSGYGGNGHHGGHAGPAQIGQSAGGIGVRLRPHPHLGVTTLVLEAALRAPTGEPDEKHAELRFADGGFIDLVARGGEGGDGGHGGDGGDGARGRAGADATRHRSGGDGGPGGDGGDGGMGTSGASGGAGGPIDVVVEPDDTHLLMLLRADVRGGDGGAAGRHGSGGSGGAGGRGGSSHSWTETERYDGPDGVRRTRTKHHRNPGGSRGPSGSRGADATGVIQAGHDGPDGRFEIVVRGADGSEARYEDRYRLRMVSFRHVSANADGVYEPDEAIEVTDLRVMNVGGMPTPPNHDVCLTLESEGWAWPDREAHLVLPHALAAGQTATVEGSLFFTVGAWSPEAPGEPLEVVDHIVHGASLPAAHRAFEGYHGAGDPQGRYTVRFPLRASPIESLWSLAPGEASRMRFSIESVSRRAFGAASDIGRAVRFRLAPKSSELSSEHVTLLDADDRPVPFDEGWVCPIDRIEPGATVAFEGTVALSASAPSYHAITFWLTLELGAVAPPHAPRPIQHRAFEVRVARRYRPVEGCELLLVTTNRTTRAAVDAWERMAARLGLTTAVFDASLEGHLDVTADRGDGSLVDHVRGGTIAILDEAMTSAAGDVRPHRLFDRDAVLALSEADVSLAIFGGQEGEVALERWLVPDDGAAPSAHHPHAAELREALDEALGAGALHATVDVHHVGFWFEPPTERRLMVRANDLSEHLRDAHPHRRFIVTARFAPEPIASAGVIKRWKLGTLVVRDTLDGSRARLVHAAPDGGAFGPEHLDGPYVAQVLLLARAFDEKLDRLEEALRAGGDAWPELRAIGVDLVNEQRAIGATPWRRGLSFADARRVMPLLRALVERADRLEMPSPEDPRAAPLIELAARLRYYAATRTRWWEWPLFSLRRATITRWVIGGMVDDLIERAFGPAAKGDAADRVHARVAALDGEERERALATWPVADRRGYARMLLREPVEWPGVRSDAEVLEAVSDRVVGAARLETIRRADAADDALREHVRAAQDRARAALLRRIRIDVDEGVDVHVGAAEAHELDEASPLTASARRE